MVITSPRTLLTISSGAWHYPVSSLKPFKNEQAHGCAQDLDNKKHWNTFQSTKNNKKEIRRLSNLLSHIRNLKENKNCLAKFACDQLIEQKVEKHATILAMPRAQVPKMIRAIKTNTLDANFLFKTVDLYFWIGG